MLVEQRGCDLHFERLFVEQIHDRLGGRKLFVFHQLPCRLPCSSRRVSISYVFGSAYFTRVGATPDLAQQLLLSPRTQLGIHHPNLLGLTPAKQSAFTL